MTRHVHIIILLFLSLHAISQIEKKDSLLSLLRATKEDTVKVRLLLNVADSYETNNQDSCRYYLEQVRQLSSSLKYDRGLYLYYEQLMILSFTKGEYDSAMQQSNSAMAFAKKIGDSSSIIKILANTGILYQYLGRFDKQLEYLLEALALIEKRNDRQKLSALYQNIAGAYYNLYQYQKSLDYILLSLKFYKEIGKNDYPNRIYAMVGQCYGSLKNTD